MDHLRACIELAARERVPELVLHAFTDGRDTSPTSSPGYLAEVERWLDEAARARHARADRLGERPLLGDGPRQPLGPNQARVRRARARRGPASADARRPRSSRPTGATRPTSSSSRPSSDRRRTSRRDRARSGDGDSVICFNFRPDRMRQLVAGAGRAGLRRVRARRRRAPCTLTTMTRYREDWAYPVAFEPSRPETDDRQRCWRRAASASCTSRRRRSIRTSPTSSTAARRSRTAARSAASCPRRGTCPPTTTSRR